MHLDSNWTIQIIILGMHQSIIISDTLRFHWISTRLSFRTICLQITQVVFLEILLHNLYIVIKLLSHVGPYSLLHQSLLIYVRFSDFICCIFEVQPEFLHWHITNFQHMFKGYTDLLLELLPCLVSQSLSTSYILVKFMCDL